MTRRPCRRLHDKINSASIYQSWYSLAMVRLSTVAALGSLLTAQTGLAAPAQHGGQQYCPVIYNEQPRDCKPLPDTFLSFFFRASKPPSVDSRVLDYVVQAMVVLQDHYFDTNFNTWPTAIDWTGAFTGTAIAGVLTTLSKSLLSIELGNTGDWKAKENLISSYYAQLVGSYFGQDILSIRGEAYDDILWVALGWIEAIKFVKTHTSLHYPRRSLSDIGPESGLREIMDSVPWHGETWFSSFAHRARVFWNLGSQGWETKLCEGGMVWNPRLQPYKNAITNELWISASISMYEYFPGDNFTSPWLANAVFPKKDPAHLQAALEGYKWLMDINMTNHHGLFVDGYHINMRVPRNTKCDVRDEMVYTYNQGVLLTGQRGLWTISGSPSYLENGHGLIQAVIKATGWDLKDNEPMDDLESIPSGRLPSWRGLGRGGVMEEQCDASGACSQDGQTFKGIFFHHLATFCSSLDPVHVEEGMKFDKRGYQKIKTAHANACSSYLGWVKHNVFAAMGTRDESGHFGMWWGAGIFDALVTLDNDGIDHFAANSTDYRNQGTPQDDTWGGSQPWVPGGGRWPGLNPTTPGQQVLGKGRDTQDIGYEHVEIFKEVKRTQQDPNARGRGRTLETQVGGLALLRAYWELSQTI